MGSVNGDLHFKMGEMIEIRGICIGDRKMNGEEFTNLTGKLDDQILNKAIELMNSEYQHLFRVPR